ncbi:MAG: hypothetical protein IJ667_08075 [Synergistaceae bacterium]|nr:hypothetical protein [Synergistaceae bacterium]
MTDIILLLIVAVFIFIGSIAALVLVPAAFIIGCIIDAIVKLFIVLHEAFQEVNAKHTTIQQEAVTP